MYGSDIVYREFQPDLHLSDYIKSYWYFGIKTKAEIPFDIFPDGYLDLLIVIKDKRIVNTRITGIWSKKVLVQYTEDTEVVGIRFKPLSVSCLMDFQIRNYLDHSLDIDLGDIGLNQQIIIDAMSYFPQLPIGYFDQHFLRFFNAAKVDNRILNCFRIVEKSIGCESVDSISKAIGISSRQLQRIVTGMIGIGLKDYSKIFRFRQALQEMKNDSLALYHYDQSHFIKDVKSYTGLTPNEIKRGNNVRFLQYYDFDTK